jgi:hypothetical protein
LNKYQVALQGYRKRNYIYFNVDYNKFRELFPKQAIKEKEKTKERNKQTAQQL